VVLTLTTVDGGRLTILVLLRRFPFQFESFCFARLSSSMLVFSIVYVGSAFPTCVRAAIVVEGSCPFLSFATGFLLFWLAPWRGSLEGKPHPHSPRPSALKIIPK